MKTFLLFLVAFLALSSKAYSQTIVTEPISVLEYCPGEEMEIIYSASGNFESDNVFVAQISNNNFANFRNYGSYKSTVSGSFKVTLPNDVAPGDNYRVRVISSSPYILGSDNGGGY